jgi:hypothetical protein
MEKVFLRILPFRGKPSGMAAKRRKKLVSGGSPPQSRDGSATFGRGFAFSPAGIALM